jgi:hypothetical protein
VDSDAVESGWVFVDVCYGETVNAWPAWGENRVAGLAEMINPWLPALGRHPESVNEHDAGFWVGLHGKIVLYEQRSLAVFESINITPHQTISLELLEKRPKYMI